MSEKLEELISLLYQDKLTPYGKTTRMNKYTRKSVYDVEVLGNKFDNPDLLGEWNNGRNKSWRIYKNNRTVRRNI